LYPKWILRSVRAHLAALRAAIAGSQFEHLHGGGVDWQGCGRQGAAMADETSQQLPDRLSLDPRSDYFDAELLKNPVGIKLNGQEKTNVQEYCVSEGWIKIAVGRSRDRYGNPMTITLKGKVEPYVEEAGDQPADGEAPGG
jgi:hypothetical protein